eukprot:TRINITY_DN262_c0_g1_i2.p1 TRINITY_DN262_c0_g1~~TRINITY_DN262_c0_g1_i2.p1  ORF type:complete len:117 (-),score=43.65 TRINITY_DN262_c0_g1_i2:74-424(-)
MFGKKKKRFKPMNIIQKLEQEHIAKLTEDKTIPAFGAGDTLRVDVKVKEGERERIQAFEGVCIARANKGISSNFTVRKISYGEGVERVFPLCVDTCLLYTSPSPRDRTRSRMPSSA